MQISKSSTNLTLPMPNITEFRITDNYSVCVAANTKCKVIHRSSGDNDEFTAVFPLVQN